MNLTAAIAAALLQDKRRATLQPPPPMELPTATFVADDVEKIFACVGHNISRMALWNVSHVSLAHQRMVRTQSSWQQTLLVVDGDVAGETEVLQWITRNQNESSTAFFAVASLQFTHGLSFTRATSPSGFNVEVSSQVDLDWDYSESDGGTCMQLPPVFTHAVTASSSISDLNVWLTVSAVVVFLCIVVLFISRWACVTLEFLVHLQLPTRVESITDNAFVVFQAIVLASAVALLGFHWSLVNRGPDGNLSVQVSHLKTMRLLLRVQKVLCGIPALNVFRYLPIRGWFHAVNLVSGVCLLVYFYVVTYMASVSSLSKDDLRGASFGASLANLVRGFVMGGGYLEPLTLVAAFGIVATSTPAADVYIRQWYCNQAENHKQTVARRHQRPHAVTFTIDRKHPMLAYMYKFCFWRQRTVLNAVASVLVMFLYATVVCASTYATLIGMQDPALFSGQASDEATLVNFATSQAAGIFT